MIACFLFPNPIGSHSHTDILYIISLSPTRRLSLEPRLCQDDIYERGGRACGLSLPGVGGGWVWGCVWGVKGKTRGVKAKPFLNARAAAPSLASLLLSLLCLFLLLPLGCDLGCDLGVGADEASCPVSSAPDVPLLGDVEETRSLLEVDVETQ